MRRKSSASAAAQIALVRGMQVIATAGDTYAQRLRDLGATVTGYGDGMVERVKSLNGGPVDTVLDTAPVSGALPDLVQIAGGDPQHVMTVTHFAAAKELGMRSTADQENLAMFTPSERFRAFPEFARLAAEGKFAVPIAGAFPLDDWLAPLEISLTGKPRGKLLLLAGGTDADR
jgi:NADPH:quinone reductase-like Zn-dependent oxidoreductase